MWGGNKATYLCMEIGKVSNSDCGGLILGPGNYEDKFANLKFHTEERRKETNL